MYESMKKHKISTYILGLISLILIWQLVSVCADIRFMRENIDLRFAQNLSSLFQELYWTKDSGYKEVMDDMAISRKVNSQMCRALFPISSYRDNEELANIMYELTLTADSDVNQQLLKDEELIDDIGYYLLHLDSEELARDIWERMQADLKSMD